ncbi:hypothetical protein V2J09_002535 [Rumex salicifolius]
MSSAFFSPPAKRPQAESADPTSTNGSAASNKRFKSQPSFVVPPGHVTFRFLCHSSRVSAVIGRAGSAIKQLQSETASKIRIEDSLPGSDDRVIVIVASSSVSKMMRLGESLAEEYPLSDAQDALVRVFERVLEVAAAADGVSAAALGGGSLTCRLLVETIHAGSVIGRGGQVVEKMKRESGCRIRILAGNKLPVGVAEGDEIVEIEGGMLPIKKALVAVSRCLQECQLAMKMNNRPSESSSQSSLSHTLPDIFPVQSSLLPAITRSSINCSLEVQSPADIERVPSVDRKTDNQVIVFKILVDTDRVGGVIGKGGSIIKALQEETGVTINIGPSVAGCKEQLVIITSKGTLESHYSQAQHATILFFSRSIEAGAEKRVDAGSSKSSYVTARLVVSDNQVGCLLGKGGATISELRKSTGAKIHIIRGNQVPSCATDKDEVVEIYGEISNVKDAIYQVTGILRDNFFPSKMISTAGPQTTSSSFLDTNIAGYRTNSSSIYETYVAGSRSTSGFFHETDIPDITQSSMASSSMYGMDILDVERNRITPSSIYNSNVSAVGNHMISSSVYDNDIPDFGGRGTHSLYNTSFDGRLREHASTMLHQSIVGPQSPYQYSSLTESRGYPGIPHKLRLSPSSSLWASQAPGHKHRGFLDIDKDLAPVSRNFELGRERMSAIVTNTSVEILVSEDVLSALYGDRVSLARLREISGARIEVHEARPGVRERTMMFSGTNDQTQVAQNLLHAFIAKGRFRETDRPIQSNQQFKQQKYGNA